jgi:hypothetical protein
VESGASRRNAAGPAQEILRQTTPTTASPRLEFPVLRFKVDRQRQKVGKNGYDSHNSILFPAANAAVAILPEQFLRMVSDDLQNRTFFGPFPDHFLI